MLANIRRETRIAALFPHERFSPSRLYPAPYPRDHAHVRAHVTIYALACIRYVYIRAWRERREDSIPLGSYTRKKNERHTGREKEKWRSEEWTKKVERTTRHGSRVEKEGMRGTPEEEGHWDARNESLSRSLGRPDRRGTKARRVPAREKGCEDRSVEGERKRENEREETGGYDRRTARGA